MLEFEAGTLILGEVAQEWNDFPKTIEWADSGLFKHELPSPFKKDKNCYFVLALTIVVFSQYGPLL